MKCTWGELRKSLKVKYIHRFIEYTNYYYKNYYLFQYSSFNHLFRRDGTYWKHNSLKLFMRSSGGLGRLFDSENVTTPLLEKTNFHRRVTHGISRQGSHFLCLSVGLSIMRGRYREVRRQIAYQRSSSYSVWLHRVLYRNGAYKGTCCRYY